MVRRALPGGTRGVLCFPSRSHRIARPRPAMVLLSRRVAGQRFRPVLRSVLIRTSFGGTQSIPVERSARTTKSDAARQLNLMLGPGRSGQLFTLRRFARHSNVAGRCPIISVPRQIGLGPKPDAPGRCCRTSKAFARSRARAVHDSSAARIQQASATAGLLWDRLGSQATLLAGSGFAATALVALAARNAHARRERSARCSQ